MKMEMQRFKKAKHIKIDWHDWIGFGLGAGFLQAPGTMGSLLGLPCGVLGSLLGWYEPIIFMIVSSYLWYCGVKVYNLVGCRDHKSIVCDEVIGMWVALLGIPLGLWQYGLAFLLFRVFDISKWVGVGLSERLPIGAHAVMLDDVVAGLWANIGVRSVIYLTGHY